MTHLAFGTEWRKAFSGTTAIAGFADAVPWGAWPPPELRQRTSAHFRSLLKSGRSGFYQIRTGQPPARLSERTSAYAVRFPKADGRLSTKECKADRLLCVATDRIAAGAAQRLISFLVAAVTKPRDPRIADHQYRRVA